MIDEPDIDDILRKVGRLWEDLRQRYGLSGYEDLVYYLWYAHRDSTPEELIVSMRKHVGTKAEQVTRSIAAKLQEEARQQGHQEGIQKGIQKGRAELIALASEVLGADSPAIAELHEIEELEALRKRLQELLKAH